MFFNASCNRPKKDAARLFIFILIFSLFNTVCSPFDWLWIVPTCKSCWNVSVRLYLFVGIRYIKATFELLHFYVAVLMPAVVLRWVFFLFSRSVKVGKHNVFFPDLSRHRNKTNSRLLICAFHNASPACMRRKQTYYWGPNNSACVSRGTICPTGGRLKSWLVPLMHNYCKVHQTINGQKLKCKQRNGEETSERRVATTFIDLK